MFGISQVAGHDLYLGLPIFSMRIKRIQFGYIRDMIVRKLQGWNERLFSQGGKEVLIKLIIQAIPTYSMSCFIIPDSIVKEIEATCARFWWGKHVWRFLHRLVSLVPRVFKAKYFPYSSTWEALATKNSSYIWKSILCGRNLIAKELRWRAGDGSSISIYNFRWIPLPRDYKVISPRSLPESSNVFDLLDEFGKCNVELVRNSFLDF
ncbi:hypothetical protein UlMin_006257 [Ulmus minor]